MLRSRLSLLSGSMLPLKRQYRRMEGEHISSLDAFISEVYLPHVRLRKRSWTVDERIARQHLSPAFGNRELASLDRRDVELWLRSLSARGLAPSTCNRIFAVFRSVCSLANIHGLLPAGRSPCAGVLPFKLRTLRARHLAPEEARRLMHELKRSPRPEALALRLLLLTGARKSEILRARWENVHLDQRLLVGPLSKSGRPRRIPLSQEAVAVIRAVRRKPGCPWLFPGRAAERPLSDLYVFWNRLRRRLGLADVRVHDLRHTFASFLVNAGRSLYEVQRLLGHSDPRTTMRYAHLGQEALLAATEDMSALLSSGKRKPKAGAASPLPAHGTCGPSGNARARPSAAQEPTGEAPAPEDPEKIESKKIEWNRLRKTAAGTGQAPPSGKAPE